MIDYINRGILVEAHISDIHLRPMDIEKKYNILKEQYVEKLKLLPKLDIVAIDGDLFDHKVMNNSDVAMYAQLLINDLVREVIRPKGATLILLEGTYGHDAGQMKQFKYLLKDNTIDVRIVQDIEFIWVKGAKILCVPDIPISDKVYNEFLFNDGYYDSAFIHGTIQGAVRKDEVGNCRLYTMEDFALCRGPIIGGHVHPGGCFQNHFYYCGSPYQLEFGDENPKGFLIVVHDLDTRRYYVSKELIQSERYVTLVLDNILIMDFKAMTEYINQIKAEQNIDYFRIQFNQEVNKDIKDFLEGFYKKDKSIVFKYLNNNKLKNQEELAITEELKQYSYMYDTSYDEFQILCQFINDDMGYIYIEADELKEMFKED